MFGSLGWQELVIVLIIVVIIFGAGRLPEIGGAVGKSIKEFKAQSQEDEAGELTSTTSTTTTPTGDRVTTTVVEPKSAAQRDVRADEIKSHFNTETQTSAGHLMPGALLCCAVIAALDRRAELPASPGNEFPG
jgi:sec-independent protein translocase protein TatA